MIINILLVISACLYVSAYWYPVVFWWATYVSMMPLLMLSGSVRNYFWNGIFWGSMSYSLHLIGIVTGIVSLSSYTSWYAWIPGILLIIYLALCTGCLWATGAWCEKRFLPVSNKWHCFFWGIWLAVYWHFMTYYSLLLLGRCEGYLFLNPIVPLAIYPILLVPLKYGGVSVYTSIVCCMMSLSIYILAYGSYQKIIILIVAWLLLIMSILFFGSYSFQSQHTWHTKVIGIPKIVSQTAQVKSACRLLCDYVIAAVRYTDAVAVVFPESSVYAWSLCAESCLATFMPLPETQVQDYIIGSFYDEQGLYRNSCYWLHQGVVQKRFDKRHVMPLLERIPSLLRCVFVQDLFFRYMSEIAPSDNERPVMQLGDVSVVPYICSELFFNKNPDDIYPGLPILALINDRWCSCNYMKNLMYLGAVIQAYAWNREILYISYSRSVYIAPLYIV